MLVAAAGLTVAQTDTKNKVADQISELIATQDAAVAKFMEEVRALPREQQREAYQKGYPQPKDTIDALSAIVRKNPADEASLKAIVEKLNAEHADLEVGGRKVAAMMKATVEAKEKLAIGKPAPEIIGKDVDGDEMKLSDYKGKIVVLDFWGDW